MTPVVFEPRGLPHGRLLAFVLVGFAGMWAYIGFCLGACSLSDASPGFLLFAAVVFGLGVAAWNWRPFRARIVLAPEGMTVHAEGMHFVPKRTLAWDRIASFAHVPGQPKSTSFYRIGLRPDEGATRGKTYDIPMQGLGTTPQKILDAAAPFLREVGYRIDGTVPIALVMPKEVAIVPIVPGETE